MIRRPDWTSYLHDLKDREICAVFGELPKHAFDRGLEVGAGDCYQAGLLLHYVRRLVSTDYVLDLACCLQREGLTFRECDAEALDECFNAGQFDLVFSSSVLEHLPNPERAVRGMCAVLGDEGIAVNIMPGPFWKLTQLALFYPAKFLDLFELLKDSGARKQLAAAAKRRLRGADDARGGEPAALRTRGNNPKVTWRRQPSTLRQWVWPCPHGAYRTNVGELWAYRRKRWVRLFARGGLRVVGIAKGPVASGYRLGLTPIGRLLERIGLASVYAYIAVKPAGSVPHRKLAELGALRSGDR